MEAHRLLKHDMAVSKIARLLRHSKDPSIARGLLQMDAPASKSTLPEGTGTRIPSFMIPDPKERAKYRPDILVMAIDSKHQLDLMGQKEREATMKMHGNFFILEIGYGGDTFYTDTYNRKKAQHQGLKDHLVANGWNVKEPIPIIFGHGGTLYQSTFQVLTELFQVPAHRVHKTLKKIQLETARRAHHTVVTRWQEIQKITCSAPPRDASGSPPWPPWGAGLARPGPLEPG